MELSFLTELYQQAAREKIPMSGQFELTPVCNLQCHMCYIHKPEEDKISRQKLLPASFWIKQAQRAKDAGMLVLSLTGGETLLYPEIDELMQQLTNMGLLLSFNTNGTLIDEERVKWFLKYPPTKINISLYGATDETYQKITKAEHGFQKVSDAIERLQEAGLNVYLNAVLVPENIQELPKMHEFAAKRGLHLNTSSYLFLPRGCQKHAPEQFNRLQPEKAAESACFDRIVMYGREEFKQSAAQSAYRLEQLEKQTEWQPSFHQCRAGQCSFAIDWKGMLHPCVMFQALEVSLAEHTFGEAWQQLVSSVQEISVPAKCMNCRKQDICPACKAAIFQETGNFKTAPEYLCRYTDHLENILKKEGSGVEISVSDSRGFNFSGCAD